MKRNHRESSYIVLLKKLYPECIKCEIKDPAKYSNHKITYGEMEYSGIKMLYENIIPLFPTLPRTFMDLGCGNGKIPIYMASYNHIIRSIGIELTEERFELAEKLLKDMKDRIDLKSRAKLNKIAFINDDIFNVDMGDFITNSTRRNSEGGGAPFFIWISNLCFDPQTTERLFDKLIEEIPTYSIICCSKFPSHYSKILAETDGDTPTAKGDASSEPRKESDIGRMYKQHKSLVIPMSWFKDSQVHIFQIVNH